jgi:hypothetical protein
MWPTLPPMSHDIFRSGGGLGVGAYSLLRALHPDEGQSAKELATATSLKVNMVHAKLRRMAEVGMCSRDDDRHWRLLPFDADHVAVLVGTAGKAKRQRRLHLAQSELRAAAVRLWKAAQTPGTSAQPRTGETLRFRRSCQLARRHRNHDNHGDNR